MTFQGLRRLWGKMDEEAWKLAGFVEPGESLEDTVARDRLR